MMKRLPIRLKIALIYVIIVIFTIPLVVYCFLTAKGISDAQGQMYVNMTGTQTAGSMQVAVQRQATAARGLVLGEDGAGAALESAQAAYATAYDTLSASIQGDAKAVSLLAEINGIYQSGLSSGISGIAAGGTASLSAVNEATEALMISTDNLIVHLDGQAAAHDQQGTSMVQLMLPIIIVVLVVYVVVILLVARRITAVLAYPIHDLNAVADSIAAGDVEVTADYQAQDEIGKLADAFRKMLAGIREQGEVLQVVAKGDYTVRIPVRGEKDVVNRAINTMLDSNNRLVSGIRESASQVAGAAAQISQGAQSLASGSTQQAATIMALSTSISEVQAQAESNTDLASRTTDDANEAGNLMGESIKSMNEMRGAMRTIEESSREIAKVIKVIDDIAFQTNILALNAAVEAARAGQHGKGFAVVADEVRNLASKSAAAAKETADLIKNSVDNVARGTTIADRTNESLSQMGSIAAANAEAISQISTASAQQNDAITEINASIGQISQVVQSNSATAEESAAASEEMNAQAEELKNLVSRFHLRGNESSQQVVRPVVGQVQVPQLPAGDF